MRCVNRTICVEWKTFHGLSFYAHAGRLIDVTNISRISLPRKLLHKYFCKMSHKRHKNQLSPEKRIFV